MKFIKWDDSFSVGSEVLDWHHRVFFEMVKEFSEYPDKTDHEAIKQRIDFLADYIAMHLDAEEKMMQEAHYPDFDSHKAVHDAFSAKILAAQDAYAKDPASVSGNEILKLLHDWFVDHIMETDKLYMPYLQTSPI